MWCPLFYLLKMLILFKNKTKLSLNACPTLESDVFKPIKNISILSILFQFCLSIHFDSIPFYSYSIFYYPYRIIWIPLFIVICIILRKFELILVLQYINILFLLYKMMSCHLTYRPRATHHILQYYRRMSSAVLRGRSL